MSTSFCNPDGGRTNTKTIDGWQDSNTYGIDNVNRLQPITTIPTDEPSPNTGISGETVIAETVFDSIISAASTETGLVSAIGSATISTGQTNNPVTSGRTSGMATTSASMDSSSIGGPNTTPRSTSTSSMVGDTTSSTTVLPAGATTTGSPTSGSNGRGVFPWWSCIVVTLLLLVVLLLEPISEDDILIPQTSKEVAFWVQERKERFPTAARRFNNRVPLQLIRRVREEGKQALRAEKLSRRQKKTPKECKQEAATRAEPKSRKQRQRRKFRIGTVTSTMPPKDNPNSPKALATSEEPDSREKSEIITSKAVLSPRKPKTRKYAKAEKRPTPAMKKQLNHFMRRHKFVTEQSFATYTTSQRRAFERDVYDYSRALGLAKSRAKASVLSARRLCGEEDYNSDDTRLDDDEMDDSSVIIVSLPASTGTETSNLGRSFSATSPTIPRSSNPRRTDSEVLPSVEIQETPTSDVGKSERNRKRARTSSIDQGKKRRKTSEETLEEARQEGGSDTRTGQSKSGGEGIDCGRPTQGDQPSSHVERGAKTGKEEKYEKNGHMLESPSESRKAERKKHKRQNRRQSRNSVPAENGELSQAPIESTGQDVNSESKSANEINKPRRDQGINAWARDLLRVQDAARRVKEDKEKAGIASDAEVKKQNQEGSASANRKEQNMKKDKKKKRKSDALSSTPTVSSPLSSLPSTPRWPTPTRNIIKDEEQAKSKPKENKDPSKSTPSKSHRFSTRISPYFPPSPKRPREQVSCIPFPPLRSTSFGLVQEDLASTPFHLLIAVIFLNKTRGSVAMPVFYSFKARFPNPSALAAAERAEVVSFFQNLGLQNQRAKKCISLAKAWLEHPPAKGRRWRRLHYPNLGDGKDIKSSEEAIADETEDARVAWEVGHLPGIGAYGIDSWRIFCRDELRGFGTATLPELPAWGEVESRKRLEDMEMKKEWTKVLPLDKELRAYLRWRWLRLGWEWDPKTGERRKAEENTVKEAERGGVILEGDQGWSLGNVQKEEDSRQMVGLCDAEHGDGRLEKESKDE
ncbi:MAG: hypothetical protein Q9186_004154 [Xanthomendoza sp. 1 TL-2023]